MHDFGSGMISIRDDGAGLCEITGKYLGRAMRGVMRIYSVVMLVLVGVVFIVGSAGLLARLTPNTINAQWWSIVILVYYFFAMMLPVDKIFGILYPIFGVCVLIMAIGVVAAHYGKRRAPRNGVDAQKPLSR